MSTDQVIEPAIFIEHQQTSRTHSYAIINKHASHRHPVFPEEIWNDIDLIPDVPPNLTTDEQTDGVVTYYKDRELSLVPGETRLFQTVPNVMKSVITSTFNGDKYESVLKDRNNNVIPHDPSVWVVDGLYGVVEFLYDIPQSLVDLEPFNITFYKYNGPTGGGTGVSGVAGLANVGIGEGQSWKQTSSSIAEIRTIKSGSNISITNDPNEILISCTAGGTVLSVNNTGLGDESLVIAPFTSTPTIKHITAGTNVNLVSDADQITINSTNPGGTVTSVTNTGIGDYSLVKTPFTTTPTILKLTEGTNISMTSDSNQITINSLSEINTGANIGTGIGEIFSNKTGVTLNLKTISAGSNRLVVVNNAEEVTLDVDQGEIDHTSLLNIGTNSHAQIDSHISDTNNPHSVTKEQVGLSNVTNILNNYTAISPPTGNDDSVIGYSVGSHWVDLSANKAYICVDSSISAASWIEVTFGTGSLIFGAHYETSNKIVVASTTGTTFVEYMSHTTGILTAGTYRIGVTYTWNFDQQGEDFIARVQVDNMGSDPVGLGNATHLIYHRQEPKDAGSNQRYLATSFQDIVLSPTTHTIDIDFRSSQIARTARIFNARIEIFRVL